MIIAVSDYDKNLALTEKICDEARITTIHNGMPDIDQALLAHPAKEPPQIIMTARFEIQKDHRTLFNALRQLKDYPWKLKLIGDGPLMDKSKKAAVESGLEERIVFLGSRSDVAEQLAESQIFVLSSHWEGLPRSIIEAMRAGLPIVATDVGGCKELVAPGENGFLFPKNDEGALLKVLKELLLDQKERERLGKESRKRFLRSFSFDLMFRATLSVYSEIITRKR
jgi:glycosyltransferase involved in cell wall biosynthesis